MKQKKKKPACSDRGNALFLILIAVALFAALSYAVTQSGRGGGTVSRETALIAAAQITQSAAALKATVDRMLITGTQVADLQFHTGAISCDEPDASWPKCTSGADCVFAPEGGGAALPSFPANISDGLAPVVLCLENPATNTWSMEGVGTAAPDSSLSIDNLSREVCAAINKGLGIDGIPHDATSDTVINTGLPGTSALCHSWPSGAVTKYSYVHAMVEQ